MSPSSSTTSTEHPRPRAPKYRSLDAWRGLACLCIVVFHAIYYSPYYLAVEAQTAFEPAGGLLGRVEYVIQKGLANLWVGVPLFFAISGYCIMAAVDAQRRRAAGLGEYMLRRMRRIYPPYWTAVGLCALAMLACAASPWNFLFADEKPPVFMPWQLTAWQWLGNLTLTESWRHAVVGDAKGYCLGVSWTLCYEEQFYLLAGLLLVFAKRRIFAGAAVITALAVAARVIAWQCGFDPEGLFFDGRWLQFAVGILVYWRVNYASPRQTLAVDIVLGTGVLAAFLLKGYLPSPVDRSTIVAAGFAWFLCVTHRWDAALHTTPWLAPLRYCGKLCYSMYLVHWILVKPIAQAFYLAGLTDLWSTLFITVPVCVAVSIAAASLFYHAVEQWCLNGPAREREGSNRTVANVTAEPA